ncbi:MAG: amylo-alpha-1,6-glucosidase [Bacteroidota bacterium]|nr:amylo-alpha-1,6-glucosidase [Bacteroidota bacterium]
MKITKQIILTLLFNLATFAGEKPLVDQIAIDVKKVTREFSFTNKESAFYYGETHSRNKSSWQGLNVMAREFFEDYLIFSETSIIPKMDTRLAIVYPYQLQRFYKNGAVETVTLLDSMPVLIIEVNFQVSSQLKFFTLFSDFRKKSDFEFDYKDEVLLIARKNHLKRTSAADYPVWVGVAINSPANIYDEEYHIERDFSPAGIISNEKNTQFTIAIAVGDTKEQTGSMLKHTLANSTTLIEKRKDRMENLLKETMIITNNQQFNKALMWAKLSLDALIMNQITKGIFAGLPWFNNYWGRDSFISLAGATLVIGNFEEAKKILTSFAAYQETDRRNTNYGRIPNIITTTHKSYNTADGTPRFVISALDYFKYSGDKKFVKDIFPVIQRSIDGTLKYHSDKDYFLVHGDEETWMDAVGLAGPWTPRGNRANDIQALWYKQLLAASEFAKVLGKKEISKKWLKIAGVLRQNFNKKFLNPEGDFIYDHIKADGTIDLQNRPNQIFCAEIIYDTVRAKVLTNVCNKLTYLYGVASLSPEDANFHPYHQHLPYYVKDAAYHNGTVWTWLSGELISELCKFGKQDAAYLLTDNLTYQILDRGAVGTISELIDAVPRLGEFEPHLSGTFSQAWSLAEFIRNIYQDYLGIKTDYLNKRIVNINPRLPSEFKKVSATIKLGNESFILNIKSEETTSVRIVGSGLRQPLEFNVSLNKSADSTAIVKSILKKNSDFQAYVDELGAIKTEINNGLSKPVVKILAKNFIFNIVDEIKFLTMDPNQDYPVLHGPKHPLLKNSEIKKRNPDAKLLFDVTDPDGDDNGDGNYLYPKNPNFTPGIFDVTGLKVRYDDESVYFDLKFKRLTNPGWHNEYGFQLTYTAIAIDTDGIPNSGQREVGMNSNYTLEPNEAFEKIIFIGGGIRLNDSNQVTLAEYIPVDKDVSNPLGDVSSSTVEFCIPQKFIGNPSDNWRFVVLVGSQDDHGGAGIGEFRNVEKQASEWTGGGKSNKNAPNVYDVLKVSK